MKNLRDSLKYFRMCGMDCLLTIVKVILLPVNIALIIPCLVYSIIMCNKYDIDFGEQVSNTNKMLGLGYWYWVSGFDKKVESEITKF